MDRFPVSIKGVLLDPDGAVVLARNDRNEWELPGGRIDPGETPEQCVAREFAEELGVSISPDVLLDAYLFEVIPGKYVFIVTYGCTLAGPFAPTISHEHLEWKAFDLQSLPANLPVGYRESIHRYVA